MINVIALSVNAIKPADGQPLVYTYLELNHPNKTIYYFDEIHDFYSAQANIKMNFYGRKVNDLIKVNNEKVLEKKP